MKNIFVFIGIFWALSVVAQPANQATESQLALQYYQAEEYDKAAVLYEQLFASTQSKIFYGYYINCLVELKDYDKAEKTIKKQIRQGNDASYYVDLGYLYEIQNNTSKAEEAYKDAIDKMKPVINDVLQVANAFVKKQKYSYAEQTYIKGRTLKTGNPFRMEMAELMLVQRKYQLMIDEYMELLDEDNTQHLNVQNELQYTILSDTDTSLTDMLRISLIKRVQASPKKVVFTDMLIWLLVQEKKFDQAALQAKAIDKRNNESGFRLMEIAQTASSNGAYDVADQAYQYVIDKGDRYHYYSQARFEQLNVLYQKVIRGLINTPAEITNLENSYLSIIQSYGRSAQTVGLLKDLAHLQAFYLNKADTAVVLLKYAIDMPNVAADAKWDCKLELGDILVLQNKIWEATLVYAQVEKANENSPTGHEARFRKSRIAFYTGNFLWAQAQLDILKGSTSKLIANDAFELSLLISENTMLDTAGLALQMFARARLLQLQNKDNDALKTLDSVMTNFKSHSLADDVLYEKAIIMQKNKQYDSTIVILQTIIDSYGYDILADNALFRLAELYHYTLGDTQKAMKLYEDLLVKFSGSIYVSDARKRFRALRGDNFQKPVNNTQGPDGVN